MNSDKQRHGNIQKNPLVSEIILIIVDFLRLRRSRIWNRRVAKRIVANKPRRVYIDIATGIDASVRVDTIRHVALLGNKKVLTLDLRLGAWTNHRAVSVTECSMRLSQGIIGL